MNINKDNLKRVVVESQKLGYMTDELANIIIQMSEGIHIKMTNCKLDLDEFTQEAAMLVIRKLNLIDTEKNIFAYITQILINLGRGQYKSRYLGKNRLWMFYEDYKEE